MSEQADERSNEFDDVLSRLENAVEQSRESAERANDESGTDDSERPTPTGKLDVRGARDVGRTVAGSLTDSQLDGVVEVERLGGEGWRVVAEVVERNSIPDTQDILGRYVISLDAAGNVEGYGRAGRYRRASFDHQRDAIAADER
ncbi:Gas vesicle synthesis protein GvpO [Haladaptatus litoreus]|uniref:Gas vesicle synthesis protein GvpO n=1 Tax=Haladaptatus litoreus TaxID=553468 RepID=A0A1N6YIH6_9EURY|nr:gas vesicle protein GvpO [Haladaptatus litoreus]SIR14374.1 Gas vesicle synthesis protein GvpO [Haladaptatus litoreus]